MTSHPDIARFDTWYFAHRRDVDEAPFWRAYIALDEADDRLRFLLAYLTRAPRAALRNPLGGRLMSAERQTALCLIGYLRGEFAADGLDPVPAPWDWPAIHAYAETQGDGWESFVGCHAKSRYPGHVARGELQIPCQPDSARTILLALAGPAECRNVAGVAAVTP